jgi:hypothetical protein
MPKAAVAAAQIKHTLPPSTFEPFLHLHWGKNLVKIIYCAQEKKAPRDGKSQPGPPSSSPPK